MSFPDSLQPLPNSNSLLPVTHSVLTKILSDYTVLSIISPVTIYLSVPFKCSLSNSPSALWTEVQRQGANT